MNLRICLWTQKCRGHLPTHG